MLCSCALKNPTRFYRIADGKLSILIIYFCVNSKFLWVSHILWNATKNFIFNRKITRGVNIKNRKEFQFWRMCPFQVSLSKCSKEFLLTHQVAETPFKIIFLLLLLSYNRKQAFWFKPLQVDYAKHNLSHSFTSDRDCLIFFLALEYLFRDVLCS